MKTAIVTGADGFIGSHLVENLLNNGYKVIGVGVNPDNLQIKNKNFEFVKLLFDDYDKLKNIITEKVDYFIHLAWQGVFGESFKDYALQLNNSKYCCDSLLISKQLNCRKFILISTMNIFETKTYLDMDKFEPRYTNIYATAKLTAEMMCKTLAYQNSIEFNCAYLAMVYGERNYSMMLPNVVINNMINNIESNLIDYNIPYDLIYVKDVVNAIRHICENGKDQKSYYVGHQQEKKFGEIIDSIKKILNPKAIINYGVYKDKTIIDFSKIDRKSLYIDTDFKIESNFDDNIRNTAIWIKNNLDKKR